MFKRTKVSAAATVFLGGMAVWCPCPSTAQETQRIEITGSAIKRIDAETALPVTVIRTEDLAVRASPRSNKRCNASRPTSPTLAPASRSVRRRAARRRLTFAV